MREIKFRLWYAGLMFNNITSIDFRLGQLRRVCVNHEPDDDTSSPDTWVNCDREKDWVLMQFTGLLDKNGKEIFEGDVVSVSTLGNKLIIQFRDGAFGYEINGGFAKQPDFAAAGGMQQFLNRYEVIGNIYENPELIALQPNPTIPI